MKIISFIGYCVFCLFVLWLMYLLVKTGSYWLFYEDMVKETIREMVAPDSLIHLINKP